MVKSFSKRRSVQAIDMQSMGIEFSLVKRWALQLMLDGATLHKGDVARNLDMEEVAAMLGDELNQLPVDEYGDPNPRFVVSQLQNKLKKLMEQNLALPGVLQSNVQRMGQAVGLNEVEQSILCFVIVLKSFRRLNAAADRFRPQGLQDLAGSIAKLIDHPAHLVAKALSKAARLHETGLITIELSSYSSLADAIKLLNENSASALIEQPFEPLDWLNGLLQLGKPAELQWDDYQHVAKPLHILRSYLKQALASQRKGANVFIYGPPGTGKTQLARLLAQELNSPMYEMCVVDKDGDALRPESRLKTLGAINNILANSRAMTLIDEVEEIFVGSAKLGFVGMLGGPMSAGLNSQKAWINQLLENNALPTLWVSNSLLGMDPAFVRRFDMVLELPVPPLGQRLRLVNTLAGHVLKPEQAKKFAECENLAPAVITRAMGVVSSIGEQLSPEQKSEALHMLVNNTLKAQKHSDLGRYQTNPLQLYDPRLVNTTANLNALALQLADVKSARICLNGPPGTGKTAFARWLSQQLDMPLLVKRASDLLSKWVGGSEANIAAAFEQARADNAVLLIDEVDSFLQQRQVAQHSWEVTQVNEMLTQMETFEGVFLASTNLMQGIDPAALRRFDIKLNFMPLRPEQATDLLVNYCRQLGITAPSVADAAAIRTLKQLTPGDFAAVARKQRLLPMQTAQQWVAALKEECEIKPHYSSKLGFV